MKIQRLIAQSEKQIETEDKDVKPDVSHTFVMGDDETNTRRNAAVDRPDTLALLVLRTFDIIDTRLS